MAMLEQDTEKMMNSSSRTILTFVLGATAGAVVALLWAPYSGAETRQKISDAAGSARRGAGRIPNAMREAGLAAKEAISTSYDETTGHRG